MKWTLAPGNKLSIYYIPLVVALFIILQLIFLYKIGIKTDLESAKYIFLADYFADTGKLYAPSFTLYLTQIFGISLFNAIGMGLRGMVTFQILTALTATIYLFITLKKIWGEHTAFVSVLLFLLNFYYQNYTVFLQTESLFFSLITILFCYLIYPRRWQWNHYTTLVLMTIILGFTRPSGILFYPSIIFFLVSHWQTGKIKKTLTFIAGFLLFILALNALLDIGGDLNFAIPFQQQMIICGVPEKGAGVSLPGNMNSIAGLYSYMVNHPVNFFSLAFQKTISFFIPFRAYYSVFHNLYLVSLFGIVYFAVFFGIKKWLGISKPLFITLILPVLIVWISVVFSCDDWHNRFLLSTYPPLIMLASGGFHKILDKLAARFR